jgi:hypothetical protein
MFLISPARCNWSCGSSTAVRLGNNSFIPIVLVASRFGELGTNMSQKMLLRDVLNEIGCLNPADTLYVQQPWSLDSVTLVLATGSTRDELYEAKKSGFAYFLEVFAIREVLEGDEAEALANERKIALLIHYATEDAYPDWLFAEPRSRPPTPKKP